MSWPVPARWDVSRSHQAITRVEVWSGIESAGGVLLATIDGAEIVSGTVTDKWVTGVRRTLDLKVPFNAQWEAWAKLPGPEIRIYSGLNWGQSEFLCPMGRFVFEPPELPYPRPPSLTIQGFDYWKWATTQRYMIPVHSTPGSVRETAAQFIANTGIGWPVEALSSLAMVPDVIWDANKTASDMITDLLVAASGEGFVDRVGQAHIQDRQTTVGLPLSDGEFGTIISAGSNPDWSNVVNEVGVSSSNADVHFYPAIAVISDPANPAHPSRIGHRGKAVASPLLMSFEQAQAMADTEIQRLAAASVSWPITAIPDPSRDAGDLITVTTAGFGSFDAVIQEVKHDLIGGPMALTLGAAV